jgi:gliding motility-associated-like protein
MKYLIILFVTLFINACCTKPSPVILSIKTQYSDACSGMATYGVGNGIVFVPSIFTPDGDGINDLFTPRGNANISTIYDVFIKDRNGNIITTLDTSKGGLNNKSWNGKLSNGVLHSGVFTVSLKVKDNSGTITQLNNALGCVFSCTTTSSSVIPNKTNCVFDAMLDLVTFQLLYPSQESCF